jgi:hypothetical protein
MSFKKERISLNWLRIALLTLEGGIPSAMLILLIVVLLAAVVE